MAGDTIRRTEWVQRVPLPIGRAADIPDRKPIEFTKTHPNVSQRQTVLVRFETPPKPSHFKTASPRGAAGPHADVESPSPDVLGCLFFITLALLLSRVGS